MFRSPVSNINEWNYTSVSINVPVDNSLRYPGYTVKGVRVAKNNAVAAELFLPVSSFVKIRSVDGMVWVELEPLLVGNPRIAGRFTKGFPNVYIVFAGITTFTDGVIQAGDSLGDITGFSLAFQFSDRIERDISQCSDLIAAALREDADPSWELFCNAVRSLIDISFLSGSGKRFESVIRLRFTGGTPTPEFEFDPAVSNLRQLTNNQEGELTLANPGDTEWLWTHVDRWGFVVSGKDGVAIKADTRFILLTDLYDWFAPQSRNDFTYDIPDFTWGNKVTTFVNGPVFFNDIFAELEEANREGGRFFLAGYSIQEGDELVTDASIASKTILDVTKHIVNGGGQCYFLPLQFFGVKPEAPGVGPEEVVPVAVILAAILGSAVLASKLPDEDKPNIALRAIAEAGVLVAGMAIAIAAKKILSSSSLEEAIRNFESVVGNLDFENTTSGGRSPKLWTLHPAKWEDNPYHGPDGFAIFDLAKTLLPGVTAYHQKIAAVKNTDWIAYCGGIDMKGNRMYDPQYVSDGPYHDVHAKVEGPAARDIAVTFIDRWNDEAGADDQLSLEEDSIPSNLPIPGETHIVQVARTNFEAKQAPLAANSFEYAPTGDRTILDTLLVAIRNAKEYIYIEDQYLTPTPEYQVALLSAADRVKSLIVLLPSSPDQPYSEPERNAFIEALLAKNSGDPLNPKVRIGFARRGYTLPTTSTEKMTGRMKLGADLDEGGTSVLLGPVMRMPVVPFWVSVNGEIMLVKSSTPGSIPVPVAVGEDPDPDTETPPPDETVPGDSYNMYQEYELERGVETSFFFKNKGHRQRKHHKGDAATTVVYNGIYIHAKCMMVDDVFASIGSANLNRRGFHSDAEANIFFVPEGLRFSVPNPVSSLRKELWSEILNIPYSIGKNLLEDPVASSKLFDRDNSTGNHFIPYTAISAKVKSLMNLIGNISLTSGSFGAGDIIKDVLIGLALTAEAINYNDLFFHATDPSSFTQNPSEPL